MKRKRLVFIFGPTGVGKSELAVKVARGLGEIVSVDSMQVYQKLERGTAKPTALQLDSVRHHLVSIVPPTHRFSAGDFKRAAQDAIDDIAGRGLLPILVGGTGLYFSALECNLDDAPKADTALREEMYREEEKDKGALYRRLMQVDPKTARRLHPNDLMRVVRALEIYRISGRPSSDIMGVSEKKRYEILKFGINIERGKLYRNIELRCDRMVADDLPGEVCALLNEGLDEKLPSMKGLGYSHFIQYLKGCYSYEETKRLFVRDTKRYAKRQLCWFRREDAEWFDPRQHGEIRRRVEEFTACKY